MFLTVPDTEKRIVELRRLFNEILEENRQILRRKWDEVTGGETNVRALHSALNLLIDEIGYLKTEQTFDRIAGGTNGALAVPPYLGTILARSQRTPYAAPRAAEINLSGFFHGANWHQVEWDEGRGSGFRWSDGATGWIEIRVDRQRSLSLEFECVSIIGTASYDDICIVVDDDELETRQRPSSLSGQTVFSASLPTSIERSGCLHRFGLRCRFPSRPIDYDPNSADDRMLGAAVSFFRFYPVGSQPDEATATERGLISKLPLSQSIASEAGSVGTGERILYAAPRAAEINLSGFFHGADWHQVEWDRRSGSGFRWSDGATGWIEIRVDRQRSLSLEFECVSIIGTASYDDICIVVDDDELETRQRPSSLSGQTVFSASLPTSIERSGCLHRFGLRCRFPSRPIDYDPNSADDRMLGAAVSFFRFYPVGSQPDEATATERGLISKLPLSQSIASEAGSVGTGNTETLQQKATASAPDAPL
ncbi:MAG: hypothetical protein AB7H90_04090 [Alphaproteobacteria bacterium]